MTGSDPRKWARTGRRARDQAQPANGDSKEPHAPAGSGRPYAGGNFLARWSLSLPQAGAGRCASPWPSSPCWASSHVRHEGVPLHRHRGHGGHGAPPPRGANASEAVAAEDVCPSPEQTGGKPKETIVSRRVHLGRDHPGHHPGSFFWGYACTNIPGGRLAEYFGGKRVFGLGIVLSALFTVLTPSALGRPRAVHRRSGLPAVNSMLATWIPPFERSRFSTIVYSAHLGTTARVLSAAGQTRQSTGNTTKYPIVPRTPHLRSPHRKVDGCVQGVNETRTREDTPVARVPDLPSWSESAGKVIFSLVPETCQRQWHRVLPSGHGAVPARRRLALLVPFLGGWPSVFYLFGGLGILWGVFWFVLIHDRPEAHPRISAAELAHIQAFAGQTKRAEGVPLPWKDILMSLPFWGLLAGSLGYDYGFYTLLTELPTYLKNIQHFEHEFEWSDFGVALPRDVALGLRLGLLMDRLTKAKVLSIITIRRLSMSVALYGAMISLVIMCFVNCDPVLAVVVLCLSVGLGGSANCGFLCSHQDIAPNFAGTLLGITNAVGAFAGVFAPMITGAITEGNHTISVRCLSSKPLSAWRYVFLITVGIYLVTGSLYVFLISEKPQYWNEPKLCRGKECDNEVKVSLASTVTTPTSPTSPLDPVIC
ncbi:putative sialin [Penaeus vannamei]|uniref:Putative sialin n=1 Tax=Penaeus vannamei TaxID=6689 RepID=A0A423T3I4_PENVA|nr:putative sialin [Penaeus vannamei]